MLETRSDDRVRHEAHQGGPTIGAQMLRALRRYPGRTAFSWDGGAMTYAQAVDLVGRMQRTFAARGLRRQATIALLTANRADAWCAGLAASASALRVTWLHPIGSLDDHLEQLEDVEAEALVVDVASFADRGGEIAARAPSLRTVFTLGTAAYGIDLSAAAASAGSASASDFADASDVSVINYTGGTTGRSKGVLRRHTQSVAMTNAIRADFEFPAVPNFLAVAPISHAAGTKIGPVLLRGGTIHLLPK
ncbi:MAG: AMP-binding protein, partial [Candidatus Eremiobacteraeota bacterium]|nr:AMP-binding protein [Candidatus Eremiobacteraeota bacterium]